MSLCWYFAFPPDVSRYWIWWFCVHTCCHCGQQLNYLLWRKFCRRDSKPTNFVCLILIFKQVKTRLNPIIMHIFPSWKKKCIYCDLFSAAIVGTLSVTLCHEINVETFAAEYHEICFVEPTTILIILMSWDLKNVMRAIFSEMGISHSCDFCLEDNDRGRRRCLWSTLGLRWIQMT